MEQTSTPTSGELFVVGGWSAHWPSTWGYMILSRGVGDRYKGGVVLTKDSLCFRSNSSPSAFTLPLSITPCLSAEKRRKNNSAKRNLIVLRGFPSTSGEPSSSLSPLLPSSSSLSTSPGRSPISRYERSSACGNGPHRRGQLLGLYRRLGRGRHRQKRRTPSQRSAQRGHPLR